MHLTRSVSCLAFLCGCASSTAFAPGSGAEASAREEAARAPLTLAAETYTLANGLRVTLHEDHSLPKVVIDTWFGVGSKDEARGRTGFAHLFEHLMFMGTGRVPGDAFDVLMESAGGSNNASTSQDTTDYYSLGPSSILPTLLWLDADRLEALADHMTQEKLDRQRDVVRNERRETTENVPYGKAELLLEPALFPPGHPYHHPVIGSHEDLEAATLADVVAFFHAYYVPGNASLVVAGDFDSAAVKPLIERTFGAVPAQPLPAPVAAAPVTLETERLLVDVDRVEFPKLHLVWHSPARFAPGDAEMKLLAAVLAGGPSTRLEQRLVLETQLAQEVVAYQWPRELGSIFAIEAVASPGVDPEALKREILDVLEELKREGPSAAELERVRAQVEAQFLSSMEDLLERADAMNAYLRYFGAADGFERDLQRYLQPSRADLARRAREVLGPGRVDLRLLPEEAVAAASSLDERPADFAPTAFQPPLPRTVELANGWRLHALERPGAGLFAGSLLLPGGEAGVPAERAGLVPLLAQLVNSGAGGRDAVAFAEAVESLGASMSCAGGRGWTSYDVGGLASRLEPTLDLFADLALRPNLDPADFEREQALDLADIQARADDPVALASQLGRIIVFGKEDAFGRPLSGWEATVESLGLEELERAQSETLAARGGAFVFAGDFDTDALAAALEARFAGAGAGRAVLAAAPRPREAGGSIVLFDRPGAPQTVIYLGRAVAPADGLERAVRGCVNTILGGTFTSRLNANLRERNNYTYGAGSRVAEEGRLALFSASSSVHTEVTAAALGELRREFERLAAEGVTEDELAKAIETTRRRLVEVAETTEGLAAVYADLVSDDRPSDFLRTQLAALDEVTLERANEHARSGQYDWSRLCVVLVGDRATVLPQLEAAGFPSPQLVDEAGEPAD